MSHLTHTSRSGFTRAAAAAHGGRVQPGMGAVGKHSGSDGKPTATGANMSGITQEPRLVSRQKMHISSGKGKKGY